MSAEWKDGRWVSTLELTYGGKVILLLKAWPDRWRVFALNGRAVASGESTDLASAKRAAENAAAEILTDGLRALGRTCKGCVDWDGVCYNGDPMNPVPESYYCADWNPREVK